MVTAPPPASSELSLEPIQASIRRTASGRPIAVGGWRRAVVGLVVGAVAGAAALVLRRSGGGA